jgi:polysaccharide biosynthesis/export protein
MGQVIKPGGYPLDSHEEVTVLQALSMAGGFDKTAQARNAKLLRARNNAKREELSVDLQRILDGKTPDMLMLPNDILFVPNSLSKKAGIRAAEAALQIATGMAVWGVRY